MTNIVPPDPMTSKPIHELEKDWQEERIRRLQETLELLLQYPNMKKFIGETPYDKNMDTLYKGRMRPIETIPSYPNKK